jgi:hypothetical protein
MQSDKHYLQNVFFPEYWQQTSAVNAKNATSEFAPVPAHINLDDICVHKEYRKIRNDHTFSYGNRLYLIASPLKHSIAKQKIEIRKKGGDNFIACFAGRHLTVSEVVEPTKPSMYDMEIQKKIDAIELAEKLGNVCARRRSIGVRKS